MQHPETILPPPLPDTCPAIAPPGVEHVPPLPDLEPRSTTPVVLTQVGIVLLVAVIPDFLGSALSLFVDHSHRPMRPFWFGAAYIIARSIVVSGLTLGMICWARERWSFFGFRAPRWRDIPWTIAAAAGSVMLYYLLAIVAWFGFAVLSVLLGAQIPLESSYRFQTVHSSFDVVWLMAMSLCNGFAEEIVMRAFLIPRFERLFGGRGIGSVLALLATAALFASYHAYQGIYGVVGAFASGIVFGIIFLKTRSVWPVFLAHALMDALALLTIGASR